MSVTINIPENVIYTENNVAVSLAGISIASTTASTLTVTLKPLKSNDKITIASYAQGVEPSGNGYKLTGTAEAINGFLALAKFTTKGILSHDIQISVTEGEQTVSRALPVFTKVVSGKNFTIHALDQDYLAGDGFVLQDMIGNYVVKTAGITYITDCESYNRVNRAEFFDFPDPVFTPASSGVVELNFVTSSAEANANTSFSIKINDEPKYVAAGASQENISLGKGEYLLNYGTTTSAKIAGGRENVFAGASSLTASVSDNGYQIITSGAKASGAVINAGQQKILGGGYASGVTVNNGGSQVIAGGGIAENVTINNGGRVITQIGAKIDTLVIEKGGLAGLNAGATILNGVNKNNPGANNTFSIANNIANGVYLNGLWLEVVKGQHASNTIVTKGELFVSSGLSRDAIISGTSAYEKVCGGGADHNATISAGGEQDIAAQGYAFDTNIMAGGVQYIVEIGYASGAKVHKGGKQVVEGGYTVGTILSGGSQSVEKGATCSDRAYTEGTIVSAGGLQTVHKGAETFDTIVSAGGSQYVYTHGVATDTIVNENGYMLLNCGAKGKRTKVKSKGHLLVESDGDADSLRISVGGILSAEGGAIIKDGINANRTDGYANFTISANVATNVCLISSGSLKLIKESTGKVQSALNTLIDGGELLSLNGWTSGTIMSAGQQTLKDNAVDLGATIHSGRQLISGGAVTSNTVLYGGVQDIESGGVASNTTVHAGALQNISGGGKAYTTTVNSGGSQHVFSGGSALDVTILAGAMQTVMAGGYVSGGKIVAGAQYNHSPQATVSGVTMPLPVSSSNTSSGGNNTSAITSSGGNNTSAITSSGGNNTSAITSSGGNNTSAITSSGGNNTSAITSSGGNNTSAITSSGGNSSPAKPGIASSGGIQLITKGGFVEKIHVSKGCQQIISYGGSARATVVSNGGKQYVSSGGKASYATIKTGGSQIVSRGGSAINTTVSSGGRLYAALSGNSLNATIKTGGSQIVSKGGSAIGTVVESKGKLFISGGAVLVSLTARKGAILSAGSFSMGGTNIIASASLGGSGVLTLGKKATLILGGSVTLSPRLKLNLSGSRLVITSTGNTVGALAVTSTATTCSYDLRSVSVKSATPMLGITGNGNQISGKFELALKPLQNIGTYGISTRITYAKNTSFTLKSDNTVLGSLKINAYKDVNGVRYQLKTASGNKLNFTLSILKGEMIKGTNASDKLNGKAKCDIFYGGKGNDKISGGGGRDVVVYDRTNWGADIVYAQKKGGTITIMLSGLSAKDIIKSSSKDGKTVVLTRASDKKQKITVQGWNKSTHEIVYGGTLKNLSAYLKAPANVARKNAACKEIWERGGLA